jgi:hypothetical protein
MALVTFITSAHILIKASTAYTFSRNIVRNRHTISRSLLCCLNRHNVTPVGRTTSKRWMNAESHSKTDEHSDDVSSIKKPSAKSASDDIPSLTQLRYDSYFKQVGHADYIFDLIAKDAGRNADFLMTRLRVQLSHLNGIRGFMITFLSANLENETIPNSILTVLLEKIDPTDKNKLISVLCEHVVMPAAMKSRQRTAENSLRSALAATRAVLLLRALLQECKSVPDQLSYKAIRDECHAILSVTTAENWDKADTFTDEKQAHWNHLFNKWRYKSRQRSDIALAIQAVLKE